jgi:hypothetical protein
LVALLGPVAEGATVLEGGMVRLSIPKPSKS